jgi:ankyrin repeat protein
MCTQKGNTVLHVAAQDGHAEVCKVLLAATSDLGVVEWQNNVSMLVLILLIGIWH